MIKSQDTTSIAIVAFSNIASDSRVLRQIQYLSTDFPIDVIGFGNLPSAKKVKMKSLEQHHLPVGLTTSQKIVRRIRSGQYLPYLQLIVGRLIPKKGYEAWYWSRNECQQAFLHLLESRPKIIHANDWMTLPLAVQVSKRIGAKVVADLHEYAPLESNGVLWHLFLRPLREYVLSTYMPQTVASITVNQTIAEKYQEKFKFKPIVIMNAPKINTEIKFKLTQSNIIHLVHHGGFTQDRKPELMLHALAKLDNRFHLNFMFMGNANAISSFEHVANTMCPGRVTFHTPVEPDQVTLKISEFDIGFYLLPTTNFNNSVASPNKFFDFIHAGLAICIGPSPEMARMCHQYGFGIVSPSFDANTVAQLLNQLTPSSINKMKLAALNARLELNSDVELNKLLALYNRLAKESN